MGVWEQSPQCMGWGKAPEADEFLPRDATQSAVLLWQVVCPSVCLSVTLRYCDYIGWKSSKI